MKKMNVPFVLWLTDVLPDSLVVEEVTDSLGDINDAIDVSNKITYSRSLFYPFQDRSSLYNFPGLPNTRQLRCLKIDSRRSCFSVILGSCATTGAYPRGNRDRLMLRLWDPYRSSGK